MASRVLFIHNDPTCPESLLGEAFTERGFDVEVFTAMPETGSAVHFPDPLSYDVLVPLGSTCSVTDPVLNAGWVGQEAAVIDAAHTAGIGVLGICFGAQLVAQTLGGTVRRAAVPEIGWYDIATDDPALVPPGPWFQWHFDQFTVPSGATEIARTASSSQAFVCGRTMGVQFHPELDAEVLEMWLANDSDDDVTRLGLNAEDLRQQTRQYAHDAGRRARALVDGFLRLR